MNSPFDDESGLDSYEIKEPWGDDVNLDLRRSAMKKPGQSRSAHKSSMMMKVHFEWVMLREYGMVLGDNPAVSHGAPVQLEWEPQQEHDPVHIDNYEKARSQWRAKDRRGFVMNAHQRVKILFAAGYTIDEIAKATMEMKELRQLRAESLKTQGLVTSVIMGLLSGAAETTGHTVRAVQIIPGALTEAGKGLVNGTSNVIVGVGTGVMGLTDKVINSTALAAKRSSSLVTGAAAEGIKGTGKVVVGTGKVVVGTGKLVVKGTTGVVKGTANVITKTGEVGMDVVKGSIKGTANVMVKTGDVGMNVVKGSIKGTSHVMVGSTKAFAKGTGVLFAGAGRTSKAGLDMMVGTSRRISRLVGTLDTPSNHGNSSSHNSTRDPARKRISEFTFGGLLGAMDMSESGRYDNNNGDATPRGRASCPVDSRRKRGDDDDNDEIPLPTHLGRQVSLDSGRVRGRGRSVERLEPVADLSAELQDMQEFLIQFEGMDKHQVQDIIASEQAALAARNSRRGATRVVNNKPPGILPFREYGSSDDDDDDDNDDDEFMGSSPPPPKPIQHAASTSLVSEGKNRRATTGEYTPPPPLTATGMVAKRPTALSKRAVSAAAAPIHHNNLLVAVKEEEFELHSMHTPRSLGS